MGSASGSVHGAGTMHKYERDAAAIGKASFAYAPPLPHLPYETARECDLSFMQLRAYRTIARTYHSLVSIVCLWHE